LRAVDFIVQIITPSDLFIGQVIIYAPVYRGGNPVALRQSSQMSPFSRNEGFWEESSDICEQ